MKTGSGRFFGKMVLFLLFMTLVVLASNCVQYIGKTELGVRSAGFLSGYAYSYNKFAYAGSLILFVAGLILGFVLLFKNEYLYAGELKIWQKILYFVVAILFFGVMFIGTVILSLYVLGLASLMEPEWLYSIIWTGEPMAVLLFMVVIFIIAMIKKSR